MSNRRYEIDPRPASLGGGWRLRLIGDDNVEEGAGVFPVEPGVTEEQAYSDAVELGDSWLSSFATA